MVMDAAPPGQNVRAYNDRLFSRGIRGYFHLARFHWAADQAASYSIPCRSVLELGCHDGRLIENLPQRPDRYFGLDANWESGIDMARERYKAVPSYTFVASRDPKDLQAITSTFDLGASLETLEHIDPEQVDTYLRAMAERVDYLIATVPNEMGPIGFGKWAVKHIFGMSPKHYTPAELFYAFIGRTDKVERIHHKGFNYRVMADQIDQHFEVLKVEGHPIRWIPTWLCFGVGIVARTRHHAVKQA